MSVPVKPDDRDGEIRRLQACLSQACRQWRMYADMQEDRDIATEQSVEGSLFRKCLEAAGGHDETPRNG